MPGYAKLVSRIPEIAAEVGPKTDAAVGVGAVNIARAAAAAAPRLRYSISFPSFSREPGELADSIDAQLVGDAWTVYPAAYWGGWVEWGTEHMRAQPYLEPAADAQDEVVIGLVERSLQGL